MRFLAQLPEGQIPSQFEIAQHLKFAPLFVRDNLMELSHKGLVDVIRWNGDGTFMLVASLASHGRLSLHDENTVPESEQATGQHTLSTAHAEGGLSLSDIEKDILRYLARQDPAASIATEMTASSPRG